MIRILVLGVTLATITTFTSCIAEKAIVGLTEDMMEAGTHIPDCDEDYIGGTCSHCKNNICTVCSEGECEEVDCSDPENTEVCERIHPPVESTL